MKTDFKRLKLILIVFSVCAGGYSIYLIVNSVFSPERKQKALEIQQMDIPKHFNKTGDETVMPEATIDEQTYLQNSGILYSANEAFDVVSVYDGTVTNVSEDEILGNVVEITHNTNLKTVYYSLGEITVKKGDDLTAGTIIGKSGDNLLDDETENCLLFEVYYNGNTIDPEEFYTMNINDLQ